MLKKQNPFKKWSISHWLLAVTILVGIFYAGYILGNIEGAKAVVPEGESRVLFQGSTNQQAVEEDIDFRMFWDVWSLVKRLYVDQPVSEKEMYYGALKGLVRSLEDPYSVFFTPQLAEEFNADLDGTFSGIGAEIGMRDEGLVIVAPLSGSPAEEAGLQSGDIIVEIDGEEAFGLSVNEAVLKIRGEEGTPVTLTVAREGQEALIDITIVRGEIHIDSVVWELRDDNIAVIEIYMFNDDTTRLFQEAAQEILRRDVDGIIVDVRNNPGGLLTAAINVAGYWIDGQTVLIERVGSEERAFSASGSAQFAGIPTVVLVNGGSASGSEILAGALQDYGVATLIGETTFGKGSVQEFHEFPDGSALKITIAEWLTPKKRSINGTGIEPDEVVEFSIEEFNAGETPQFQAALDFLKGK